jgi:anaerobic ribonucleoside-triphosphate reductase activating protein
MKIEVNRLHYPVTALGPGTRAGIWVQGCSIECRGCISRDTWDRRRDTREEVSAVVGWMADLPTAEIDGVTISGGEPFDQPESLLELLVELDAWRTRVAREIDVLCYSGYSLSRLERRHPHALELIDAVLTGPFREDLPTDLIWRGSANQELVPLSDLGRARYADFIDCEPAEPPIQVAVEPNAIRLIGVPRLGDMAELEAALNGVGVELGESSWTP